MRFSSRVPERLDANRLTAALLRARVDERPLVDLTVTNPTTAGIEYPEGMLQALSRQAALRYVPAPFGSDESRLEVAREYERRGVTVDAARVALTASTSEAYSLLFKLLCEPSHDCVLVPVPSYPLFDHLTRLDGVRAVPYRLEYHGRWCVDWDSVDTAMAAGPRAVLAVSPNNPTGSSLTGDEVRGLDARCAAANAALIVDEVFADYPLDGELRAESRQALPPYTPAALTFRLGGLSKSVGLPQVKLGWIAADGPAAVVEAALERLEFICDTYLSVSTPVQVAARELLTAGAEVRGRILARVRQNYSTLRALAAAVPSVDVLRADAGWSAVLRVPSTSSEEDMVLDLLQEDGVLVHPGFFFDFPHEAFLVVSLLPDPAAFATGVGRILQRADG